MALNTPVSQIELALEGKEEWWRLTTPGVQQRETLKTKNPDSVAAKIRAAFGSPKKEA